MIIFLIFLSRGETSPPVPLAASSKPMDTDQMHNPSVELEMRPPNLCKQDLSQIAGPSDAVKSNIPANIRPRPVKQAGRSRMYPECENIGVERMIHFRPIDIAIHLMKKCRYALHRVTKKGRIIPVWYVLISLAFIL
jgi:hypothetical protein